MFLRIWSFQSKVHAYSRENSTYIQAQTNDSNFDSIIYSIFSPTSNQTRCNKTTDSLKVRKSCYISKNSHPSSVIITFVTAWQLLSCNKITNRYATLQNTYFFSLKVLFKQANSSLYSVTQYAFVLIPVICNRFSFHYN